MSLPSSPTGAPGVAAPAYYDFTPDLLAAFPLTELAAALRSRIDAVVLAWGEEVRANIPAAGRLPFEQAVDSVPAILHALADAVGSADAVVRRRLIERSPSQGISRFQQHYDPRDLMLEDRLLRRTLNVAAEDALGRRMSAAEQLALGMGLDLMSQQAVVGFIEHQAAQLREAAESELRYLSFLSHDLNNNLNGVTLWLQVLRTQLQPRPEFAGQVASIDTMQQSILTTIGGMGRLLQAERLRHGGVLALPTHVNLLSLVTNQTRTAADLAARRGLTLRVDVPPDAIVFADAQLLALVLQNLIGNAVKFASGGEVRVRGGPVDAVADAGGKRGTWTIAVEDDGPGIPREHLDRMFLAFQRGTMEGTTAGVGLGLAIASRAAAQLGGTLTIDSELGRGSTFTLTLPAS